MAKARGLAAKLDRLRSLRDEPVSPEMIAELRKFLDDASNLVVAEAAAAIGAKVLPELAADLVVAFERLMIDPEDSDKYCRAKIAIAEALNKLEYSQPEVFQRGINHVQDPIFDRPGQDAAGALRAHCAFGLARVEHVHAVLPLTDLLADSDNTARAGTARALGATGSRAAVALLRFKAKLGDTEAQVVGECLSSLLMLDAAESLRFVARFLQNGSEGAQEAAIFALAESRRAEALTLLKDFWPQTPHGLQEALLLAIAMFRSQAALDFLLGIVRTGGRLSACAALSALKIHRHDGKVRELIAAAVSGNADVRVRKAFETKFPALVRHEDYLQQQRDSTNLPS